MKTRHLFILISVSFVSFCNAQWQLTGNANTTSTSFLGTTSAAPATGQDVTFKRASVTSGLLSTTKTSFGVNSLAMPNSVSFGVGAGQFSSGTGFNTYIGQNAGKGVSVNNGNNNTFIGYNSGANNQNGSFNTALGSYSSQSGGINNVSIGYEAAMSTTSTDNVSIGYRAGKGNNGFRNIFLGSKAGGGNTAGNDNIVLGFESGLVMTGGSNNIFMGNNSGRAFDNGGSNIFLGQNSGQFRYSSNSNVFIGHNSGWYGTDGTANTFLGNNSGANSSGNNNVMIGEGAGGENGSGNNNVFIGKLAGFENLGSGNVLIGNETGNQDPNASNKLYIDNNETLNPLIWGDFAADQLKFNGKVGIGGNTTTGFGSYPTTAGGVSVSNYNLFVTGGILTEEVRVNLRGTNGQWADYVFAKDYDLKPLSEVETFINNNGHLPNVPCAEQVKEEGIELGEMAKIQQEKIEELTLYLIQQNKQIEELKAQVKLLLDKK